MFKLLKYADKYKIYAFICPVLMIGEVMFELLIPQVMADIVETILLTENADAAVQSAAIHDIFAYGGKMLIFAICSLFCGSLAARVGAVAGMGFGASLRHGLMEKLQTFSFSNIDKFSTASLITRMTTDVNTVQNTFLMLIRVFFRAPIMLVSALILCIRMSPEVASVFAVALPIIVIVLAIFAPIAIKRFRIMLKKFDKFNASIQENFTNIRVVKAFVRTDYEKKKFKKSNDDVTDSAISAEKIMVLGEPALMLLMYLTIMVIVIIATKAIAETELEVGQFTAIFTYAFQILMSDRKSVV